MSHSQNQRRHLPKDYLRDKAGCGMLTTTPNPSAQNKKYLGWTDQLKAKQERLSFNLAVLGSLSTQGDQRRFASSRRKPQGWEIGPLGEATGHAWPLPTLPGTEASRPRRWCQGDAVPAEPHRTTRGLAPLWGKREREPYLFKTTAVYLLSTKIIPHKILVNGEGKFVSGFSFSSISSSSSSSSESLQDT